MFVIPMVLSGLAVAQVTTVEELTAAVNDGAPGDLITIAPGVFALTAPLRPKAEMTIRGAGAGKTRLESDGTPWEPGPAVLGGDGGTNWNNVDCDQYLMAFEDGATNVTIEDLTLRGPDRLGAICAFNPDGLELARLEIRDVLWSGVRTYGMADAEIHHNRFVNAGGRTGVTTGATGGGLFLTFTQTSDIHDNRFSRTPEAPSNYFGIKGRQARNSRIHHNTIEVSFAIELPFENDQNVEIDHNLLRGTVSIPKFEGGPVPDGGFTFHLHHNYSDRSYAVEFARNGIEIDHNLFDFSIDSDGGNLVTGFGNFVTPGPAIMHDNLIANPGRGVFWSSGVYQQFAFFNNHVRGMTTVTPRTEGLFGFAVQTDDVLTDWSTIVIRDNLIELEGQTRPLMRNEASYAAIIENNTLINVSDVDQFENPTTGAPQGPTEPLFFLLGADEEYVVDGWELRLADALDTGDTGLSLKPTGDTGVPDPAPEPEPEPAPAPSTPAPPGCGCASPLSPGSGVLGLLVIGGIVRRRR